MCCCCVVGWYSEVNLTLQFPYNKISIRKAAKWWKCVSFSLLFGYSLVKERSTMKNFQLIVITHDDAFVEMLGRSQFVDDYYKVTKDRE